MRRREKYTGLVWLRRLPGDPAEGRLTPRLEHLGTMASAVTWLLTTGKRLVELEERDGFFAIQVYPRKGVHSPGVPAVAASYIGSNLRNILWQAVDDLIELGNCFDQAEIWDREAVRWVA